MNEARQTSRANHSCDKRSLFWPAAVIGIIGFGYLYQQEGGKLFGTDGLLSFIPIRSESTGSNPKTDPKVTTTLGQPRPGDDPGFPDLNTDLSTPLTVQSEEPYVRDK